MPRAASSERRRGLNLASAWSPASGDGECGARLRFPWPAPGREGALLSLKEGRRLPRRLLSKGGLFRSLRRLLKTLSVRVGPRAGFHCQQPSWSGVGGALRGSPSTHGPWLFLLGRQKLPLEEEKNCRLLTAWKLFRRNHLWNILILINCFPRGPLLSLERVALLNFTGFVSVGKVPDVLWGARLPPSAPPPALVPDFKAVFLKGVFHCYVAKIKSWKWNYAWHMLYSELSEREECFPKGWGTTYKISIHPASGGGGVCPFFLSLMYFGITFSFNGSVVVPFCVRRLLNREWMSAHMRLISMERLLWGSKVQGTSEHRGF